MAVSSAEQLNINYIRLPKNAKLSGLPFGLQQVIGEIYSFTGKDKGGKELSCFRTWEKFQERCCVSRSTVGRALKFGREHDIIKGNNKKGFVCLIEAEDGEFLRLPQWVCKEEFSIGKTTKRKLKKSERKVYALLYTRCTAKGNGKHTYEATIEDIAEELSLSERTVQRALRALIWAGLVYQPKEDKGRNAYKTSRYTLNYKLVLLKEKEEKERRKEILREAERAKAEKAIANAASETLSDSEVGKEEFVLHSRTKDLSRRRQGKKSKIDIPEMQTYLTRDKEYGYLIDFDLSGASDEVLKALYAFYSPSWGELSSTSQSFLEFIRIELKERGSPL